jgi:WD domain, G-beta repeat
VTVSSPATWESRILDRLMPLPVTPLTEPRASAGAGQPAATPGLMRAWAEAGTYALRHAAEHAVAAGRLDELLVDPQFLVHAEAATLAMLLTGADSVRARRFAAVYRTSVTRHHAASPAARRDVLAVDAVRHRLPALARALRPTKHRFPWHPSWATGGQINQAHQATFLTRSSQAIATACSELHCSPAVQKSAVASAPLQGHSDRVAAVAWLQVRNRPVAVTGGWDATVRIWDLSTGTPIGAPLTGHTGVVSTVACTVLDGRPVAVTGGWDATVRIWDLSTGTPIGAPLTGHTRPVHAAACTVLDGRPVAVTGGWDATVRIWDLSTGTPIGAPLTGHIGPVDAVACEIFEGFPIAGTSGEDGVVLVWDLVNGTQLGSFVLPGVISALVLTSHAQALLIGFSHELVCMAADGSSEGGGGSMPTTMISA